MQGLILVSPGLDAIRTFVTSILERLQIIALLLCPNARIVPAPPFEDCTEVPELVWSVRFFLLLLHNSIPIMLPHTSPCPMCTFPALLPCCVVAGLDHLRC